MKALLAKALDFLRYPSTWQGLVTLVTTAGVALKPDQAAAIATAGASLFGAIHLFFSDSDVTPK